MKLRKSLSVVLLAGLATFGSRLLAQDAPAANQRPMQGRMQERMGAGMMQGHQEIADAVTQIRENIAKLQQETDLARVKAGLVENEQLLVQLEGKLASRRTMMQLRMPQAQQGGEASHEGRQP
ncbi:MAG: hypothetical protein O3A53_12715 [Acidobacteria bacterium]|nr:hypothetical protein [Acidobacteriota bacterium]MDA1235655.1 hypothetical protein [Acidobacteriota bacterium]